MSKLFLIIPCLLLAILIGLFLIWPKYQELSTLGIDIENKETEFRYIETYFAKLEQTSQELKNYGDQISKINFALSPDSSSTLLSLVNFIQNAASQNGLILSKINSFSVSSPKSQVQGAVTPSTQAASKIKEISVDFEMTGSYFALKNFLNTLEKSAKIIDVENISFSVKEREISSFSLKIKTYSY